jgi:hypothetical protein
MTRMIAGTSRTIAFDIGGLLSIPSPPIGQTPRPLRRSGGWE